jgi:hypothetical protein
LIDKDLILGSDCSKVNFEGVPSVDSTSTSYLVILPMKSPAEYLAPHVFEARRPRRELQPVVGYADALHAVEQALADAEKYKYLLMRALRRHADEVATTAAPQRQPEVIETPVLPMYPAGLPLAA